MPSKRPPRGICSSCVNAPSCMYVRARRGPIYQCEDHSSYIPVEPRVRRRSRTVTGSGNPDNAGNPTARRSRLRGLCASCGYAETCSLSHSEGGVWHCEEYE
jgi:hypothetical protein